MNYITITTPDNIEIEYRLSGPGSRIAAAVIDTLIQLLMMLVVLVAVFFTILGGRWSNIFQLNDFGWALAIIIISFFLIYFMYFIISEITLNGQTVGKRLFKLRVIRENGAPITLVQSIVRNLLRFFIDNAGVGVITIMFSKKCKRLGDLAAGTIVVSENPVQNALNINDLMATSSIQTPIQNNLILTQREYNLLRDYFNRRDNFRDGGEAVLNHFIKYISNKFSIPPDKLNEEILFKILQLNKSL